MTAGEKSSDVEMAKGEKARERVPESQALRPSCTLVLVGLSMLILPRHSRRLSAKCRKTRQTPGYVKGTTSKLDTCGQIFAPNEWRSVQLVLVRTLTLYRTPVIGVRKSRIPGVAPYIILVGGFPLNPCAASRSTV